MSFDRKQADRRKNRNREQAKDSVRLVQTGRRNRQKVAIQTINHYQEEA